VAVQIFTKERGSLVSSMMQAASLKVMENVIPVMPNGHGGNVLRLTSVRIKMLPPNADFIYELLNGE